MNSVLNILFMVKFKMLIIKINLSNLYLFPFLMLSIIMGSFMNSLFAIWMIMEINMVLFLMILFNSNTKNSIMKYFIIQSSASSFFFFSLFVMYLMDSGMISFFKGLMFLSLILKLGVAPFHSWYLSMIETMDWLSIFMLSTIQKILPLLVLSISMKFYETYLILIMTSLVSLFLVFEVLIKRMIGYSSVFNTVWLLSIISCPSLFYLVFLSYSITLFGISMLFFKKDVNKISNMNLNSTTESFAFLLLVMSMIGVPPFLGFWFKVLTMSLMVNHFKGLMVLFFLLCTIFTLKAYLSMSLKTLFMTSYSKSFSFKYMLSFSLISVFIMAPPIMFLLLNKKLVLN